MGARGLGGVFFSEEHLLEKIFYVCFQLLQFIVPYTTPPGRQNKTWPLLKLLMCTTSPVINYTAYYSKTF